MRDGAEREIFQVLGASDEALHVTEISRRVQYSRPTVYEALKALQEEGVVIRHDRVGNISRYGLNPDHELVVRYHGKRGGQPDAAAPAAGKLLVVEVDNERLKTALRADPARGVGLEVWVTSLEEARALGKLQKAIERLGIEGLVERVYEG